MAEALAGYEESAVVEGDGRYAMDKHLHIEFFRRPVFNSGKSEAAGRPVYDEADFVQIYVNRNLSHVEKVNEQIKQRFASRWDRYQRGLEHMTMSGTPLEQWPAMSVSMVANLKAMKIFTVEQLAEMDDNRAQEIMGNFDLRRKAKIFLDLAAGSAANEKLESELKKRDEEINLLKAQMQGLLNSKAPKAKAEPVEA